MIVDGRDGGHRGVEKGSLSFHVISAVKNENKESSTVFEIESMSSLFGSRKKKEGICVAFSQILSPCGLICVWLLKLAVSIVTLVVFTPGVVVYLL